MKMSSKFVLLTVVILLLSACGGPTQPVTIPISGNPAPAPTTLPPSPNPISPTAVPTVPPTSVPSPIPDPTLPPTQAPTPVPTALPNLAVAGQGFQVWCLPLDAAGLVGQTSAPPANARIGAYMDGYKATRVIIPASACTLAYTFNQPVPKDVTLEAYYFYGGKPWLTAHLTPAADNPNLGYLILDHPDVVNPPLWRVDYQFKLKSNGADLRTDVVSFYKLVQRCWEGSLPDPVTLHCPESDSREPEASLHPDVPPSGPDVIK